MIKTETKFTDQSIKVVEATEKAAYSNLKHAAYSIRKDASKSILHRKDKRKSSPEGSPPFQHRPGFLRRALWTAVDQFSAVVGFRKSIIGMVAATHEHGLTEEGRQYPERPTMRPALERNLSRFHRDWRSSIGN